ncbi:MAG: hypothetical protein OXR73_11415 [Myxococcales bacterium]|nr:hypothetical protein [Myxococcales bacterium]
MTCSPSRGQQTVADLLPLRRHCLLRPDPAIGERYPYTLGHFPKNCGIQVPWSTFLRAHKGAVAATGLPDSTN